MEILLNIIAPCRTNTVLPIIWRNDLAELRRGPLIDLDSAEWSELPPAYVCAAKGGEQ